MYTEQKNIIARSEAFDGIHFLSLVHVSEGNLYIIIKLI